MERVITKPAEVILFIIRCVALLDARNAARHSLLKITRRCIRLTEMKAKYSYRR